MTKTGPQFDPQPGDVMTYDPDGGSANTRTVTKVEDGMVYFDLCWIRGGSTNLERGDSMTQEFWAADFDGAYTYSRPAPAAPKARTAEDARTNPRPGDTMKYAHDADVYTVTAVDDDTVTCTVNLSRTHWLDSWGGDWTYTPGVAPTPTPTPEAPDYKAQADAARKDAQDALAAAEKAGALAERTAGTLRATLECWNADYAALETARLYLTACYAVMSPAQCAAVEVLVALAGRA